MTSKRAIEILTAYNEWRRGDHEPCSEPYSPKEIGIAIDMGVNALQHMNNIQRIIIKHLNDEHRDKTD